MHEDTVGQAVTGLREAGYAVEVSTFSGRAAREPWLAAYAASSALAALLVYPLPLMAAAVAITAVVLHARESDGRPLVSWGTQPGRTLVARVPEARSAELVIAVRARTAPPRPRPAVVTLHALMAAVVAAGAAAWIAEAEAELAGWLAPAGIGTAATIVVLAFVLYLRPDGVENAAAGALVAVAPRLRDPRTWLVVFDGDGLDALIDEHREALAGATWLGLEASPDDVVAAVSEEGTWRERRANRWLLDSAEEAGAAVRTYRSSATVVTPLLARRRRALTLLVPNDERAERVVVATALAALEPR